MVTINTTDDLLRALAENPGWRDAVRREILTEELLNLPARFDRFVATTAAFMAEQRQVNARQQQVNAEQQQFNENTANFIAEQQQFNAEQRQINAEQQQFNAEQRQFNARMEQRMDRMQADTGLLRADYARRNAIAEAAAIAYDMGFRLQRTLTRSDLLDMHQAADTAGINRSELISFRRADLVIAAAAANGDPHYIVVEISYTADERDTVRALRHAGLLARFTGRPAHAAIASVRNDDRIQPLIASGQIHWHQLDDRIEPVE